MTDAIFEDVNIKILWVDLSEQDRENYRMYSVESTLYTILYKSTMYQYIDAFYSSAHFSWS